MHNKYVHEQLMNIFCKEFQSVWLIKMDDQSLEVFAVDNEKAVPNSVKTVENFNSYDAARLWYVENCVVEHSKARVLAQTKLDVVISKIENGDSYFVEYGRISGDKINFNQLYYNKIVDEDGNIEYVVMGFRSIDMAKKAEIDDLTGLLARQVFFDKSAELLKDNPDKKFDILITDILDFKKINETYGVGVADEILRWEGKYLLEYMNEDIVIGRYGGDQMVAFGPHEQITKIISDGSVEKFCAAESANGLPAISVKFGVYVDIRHDRSIISSCDKAHMALNSIKYHYDKDIAFYSDEIEERLEKKRRIEHSMHKSLRDGDFKVYYQPKHDAQTGELVGAEALIRWIHPEYGFMNPGDFIPLFEQNGFIVENDRYVWNRTCENLKKWQDKGIKTVPISVNASKLTMANADIVNVMKQAIFKNKLRPSQLHIEITESLMTENTSDLVDKLNDIRTTGFKVELDDFGSGYSSINILSTLPIDILKLDMSFMQQFGDEKRSKVLVACINLAKELGFKTVSEGVELEEQNKVLGKLGVDMIQGYYYSRPLPEDEFEEYMIKKLA